MRDPEVGQVGHERLRLGEVEARPELQAVRRPHDAAGPVDARRSSTIERAATSISPCAATDSPTAAKASAAVSSTTSQRAPKRAGGSVNSTSSWKALKRTRNEASSIGSPAHRVPVDLLAVEEGAEQPAVGVVPVALGHLAALGAEPPHVGQPRAAALAVEELRAAEDRVGVAQLDAAPREVEQVGVRLAELPVEPRQLVVLAPGVVVALLGAAHLVAAEQHRDALGEHQRGDEVALLAAAQRGDRPIVGRPLGAAVPRAVVVGAVLAALAVGVVVLLVVGDEVGQREAVVGGDEVDRGERLAAVGGVQVARPGEALGEGGDARLPAPEVADRVAVDPVPLRPQDGEVADLVAAGADVPRLGDQLDLRQHRVLVDRRRRTRAGGRRRRARGPASRPGRSGSRRRGTRSPSSAASP